MKQSSKYDMISTEKLKGSVQEISYALRVNAMICCMYSVTYLCAAKTSAAGTNSPCTNRVLTVYDIRYLLL